VKFHTPKNAIIVSLKHRKMAKINYQIVLKKIILGPEIVSLNKFQLQNVKSLAFLS